MRAFLALIIFLTSLRAFAFSGGVCSTLFADKGTEIINALGDQSLLSTYPLYRKRFIRNMVNNLKYALGLEYDRNLKVFSLVERNSLYQIIDPVQIEKLSSELFLALYGSGRVFDDYFYKTKDERQKESVMRKINEIQLRKGLMGVWQALDYHPNRTVLSRLNVFVIKLLQNRILNRFLQFPFLSVNDLHLSEELMAKIIVDGFDAHKSEVELELKGQNWREGVNTFMRVARASFFAGALLVGVANAYVDKQVEVINLDNNVQQTTVINQLQNIQIEARMTILQQKENIINQAFESAKKEFVQKWGEDPTSDEAAELHAKIVNALVSKNAN